MTLCKHGLEAVRVVGIYLDGEYCGWEEQYCAECFVEGAAFVAENWDRLKELCNIDTRPQ